MASTAIEAVVLPETRAINGALLDKSPAKAAVSSPGQDSVPKGAVQKHHKQINQSKSLEKNKGPAPSSKNTDTVKLPVKAQGSTKLERDAIRLKNSKPSNGGKASVEGAKDGKGRVQSSNNKGGDELPGAKRSTKRERDEMKLQNSKPIKGGKASEVGAKDGKGRVQSSNNKGGDKLPEKAKRSTKREREEMKLQTSKPSKGGKASEERAKDGEQAKKKRKMNNKKEVKNEEEAKEAKLARKASLNARMSKDETGKGDSKFSWAKKNKDKKERKDAGEPKPAAKKAAALKKAAAVKAAAVKAGGPVMSKAAKKNKKRFAKMAGREAAGTLKKVVPAKA